jgi:hypothetical protein
MVVAALFTEVCDKFGQLVVEGTLFNSVIITIFLDEAT